MPRKGVDEESARERQSRVAKAGELWEEYVRAYLSDRLESAGIEIVPGKHEETVRRTNPTLWNKLSIPAKGYGTQDYVWGDVDLVATRSGLRVVVISCKLSLHGRFTETLFWSLLFRILTRTKVVLATPDAGSAKAGDWRSEWGDAERTNKG